MPHVWEVNPAKVAVMVEELVPECFNCLKTLQTAIRRHRTKSYGIKQLQRACYGRPMLIDYDSLPRDMQQALGDPRKCAHLMEKWYKEDAEAVRFFTAYSFENGTGLEVRHQDEYIINASVLQALKAYKEAHEAEHRSKNRKAKKPYAFITNEAVKFQETLKAKYGVQHSLPTSERRMRPLFDDFFKPTGCDYATLISGKLQNENARKVTDKMTALLNSLFAKAGTKPSKLKVARRYQDFMEGFTEVINNETGEMYNPADFKPISDRAITKWLSGWDSKIGTYSLRGADRQKLKGQFSVAHEMTRPVYAGSLISVDDRQPPFEYAPGRRIWLYNCLDVASDAITATVWGKDKEGMILDFYRQIVRNYTQWGVNLPAELEAETSLNSSFKNTFLRNGAMFEQVRLEANNARGKIIENRNRQFRLGLEKEMEGWKGRPFARDEANQALPSDNEYREQQYRSYESLVKQSLKTIEDWNNMPCPSDTTISRWDYFINMQHPNLKPVNWRAFMPHLGYKTNTSCQVGKIQVDGIKLMLGQDGKVLFAGALIEKMKMIEGQDVVVYWLDGNDGQILKALVYMGDTYICEAIPTPKYNRARIEQTEQDELARQIQSQYTATVDGYMRLRKNEIESVTVIEHKPKRLNNNFVMPGLELEKTEMSEPQVIEDIEDEYDMMPVNRNSSRNWKNRF